MVPVIGYIIYFKIFLYFRHNKSESNSVKLETLLRGTVPIDL